MTDKLAELEWRADVLQARADALTRPDADPCWDGYEQRGTKEKDGKTVPNCVESDAAKADAPGDLKFGPKSRLLFAHETVRKFEALCRTKRVDPLTKAARELPGYEDYTKALRLTEGNADPQGKRFV